MEDDKCLRHSLISELHGEVRVDADEKSQKVGFPRADCTFGGVSTVNADQSKLELNLILAEVGNESRGGLIV